VPWPWRWRWRWRWRLGDAHGEHEGVLHGGLEHGSLHLQRQLEGDLVEDL
jgi:hypothetical protein